MDQMGGKPACGSGTEAGEYDLALHVVGLFLVLAASILGAGFPVVAKKVKWVKVPPKVFFICKHFGTGVLIATAFVHLLPTAFGNLLDPCLPDLFTEKYPPMPGVIMMGSMFCLFIIEMYINGKIGGRAHSHDISLGTGVPPPRPSRPNATSEFETVDLDLEKKMAQELYMEMTKDGELKGEDANAAELPPWFAAFYKQHVHQKLEMDSIKRSMTRTQQNDTSATTTKCESAVTETPIADSPYVDLETGQPVDPDVYRKMSLNITLLEGGILFHSVFVGMTVSITIEGFVVLLVAILFHQAFEGLGLGSRIAAVPYPRGSLRPWLLVFAFGTTAPIGQAIGLATRGSYDPNSAFGLIIVGVFNAISSGLLLYASLVDLLAEDFLSEEASLTLRKKDRVLAFVCVILGAIGMSIVGAFA